MSERPQLSMILAVSANGVIGCEGGLPWSLPSDLERFFDLTKGSCVIMGRRTAESIHTPLPERKNIVLTSRSKFKKGFKTAHSLDEALEMCEGYDEVFVIGGKRVYEEAEFRADKVYITRVMAQAKGDVKYMPTLGVRWELKKSEGPISTKQDEHPFIFEVYERAK